MRPQRTYNKQNIKGHSMKTNSEIRKLKADFIEICKLRLSFLELDARLKRFGKSRCRFNRNRKGHGLECQHPDMGWGGINRNTDCELVNCPRILCKDEG